MQDNCPHCSAPVQVSPDIAGRPIVCPVCRGQFVAMPPEPPPALDAPVMPEWSFAAAPSAPAVPAAGIARAFTRQTRTISDAAYIGGAYGFIFGCALALLANLALMARATTAPEAEWAYAHGSALSYAWGSFIGGFCCLTPAGALIGTAVGMAIAVVTKTVLDARTL